MAENRINLNNFKSSGVYTIEVDQSENIALPLTSGRLIVGSSRVGPFNTVVLINDVRTLKAVFGEIDPKLEKSGGFFHRSIEVALREGPVFALNILPVDTESDPSLNLDKVVFTTFNTEVSANNEDNNPISSPIVNFFNRSRLWFADAEELNKTKNIETGDNFILNPGGFGKTSIASNKILSFVNTGKSIVTIWVKHALVTGFDVTAKEWYNTIGGGTEIEFPTFVHDDDFISDYMVEVMIVNGDWTNYLKLSKDPIYKQFFNESGLIDSKAGDFFSLREINVISRTVGSLIPNFIDQSGNSISIDKLVNRLFPTTGVICSIDVDKLELINLENIAFTDVNVDTHRIDLIGHGFDELSHTADDGGIDTDLVTPVPATQLIDIISYCKPADDELIFSSPTTSSLTETVFLGTNPAVAVGDTIVITGGTVTYIAAIEDSKLYNAFSKGFVKNGDIITDGTLNYYIKIDNELTVTVGNNTLKYIKLVAYQNILLLNPVNINTYTVDLTQFIKIKPINSSLFKNEFDLTNTAFFSDYSVTQPNVITLGINTTNPINKALIDEFFKVNHYIKGKVVGSTRNRVLKIISVKSTTTLSPFRLEYTITTMSPSVDEVSGIDATGSKISVYKGVRNFVKELRGQFLKGFKLRNELFPNSTAIRQQEILSYLFDFTSIPQALAGKEIIDFRYIVDTYEGEISSASKYYLSKLSALHGQSMSILNAPSIKQFEKSVEPSFIDFNNKLISARLIADGGDLSLNPSFTFAFAEEDVNGVPLSSYSMFNFPNLIIRSGNRDISVPPAAYISNLYVRKFKNGQPFLIVAGGKRGNITDPELIGVEYELTNEDRDFLEPIGHNLIVKRRGFGTLLLSNNTAYQRINSALNSAHVRDNLSTIERDLARILFNFLFDFNDEITRLRVKTIVENYLDSVVSAKGLSSYSVIFDKSNNTDVVIENRAAIIDVIVDFPRGIHRFINRITITRVGGALSSDQTGFTPSF